MGNTLTGTIYRRTNTRLVHNTAWELVTETLDGAWRALCWLVQVFRRKLPVNL